MSPLMDEETDLGQDYREPIAPPQQTTAAPATFVAPPGRAPILPPASNSGFLSPDEAARQTSMRKLQYAIADLPLAEAEQAVSAALKFQAVRGYQQDLARGVSANEALAKWAPIMFTAPKAGNLAGAASLVRATRPEAEKYMDIGGVGYQMKGGKATPLTPPKPEKKKTIPMVLPADPENPLTGGHITIPLDENDPMVKKAIDRARSGPPPVPPQEPGFVDRLINRFTGRTPPPGPAPSSAPVPAPAPAVTAPSPIRAAKPQTPEEKLAAAKALRQQHPDWSKKQILDAVNQ